MEVAVISLIILLRISMLKFVLIDLVKNMSEYVRYATISGYCEEETLANRQTKTGT